LRGGAGYSFLPLITLKNADRRGMMPPRKSVVILPRPSGFVSVFRGKKDEDFPCAYGAR
jgi:hypothetical protein